MCTNVPHGSIYRCRYRQLHKVFFLQASKIFTCVWVQTASKVVCLANNLHTHIRHTACLALWGPRLSSNRNAVKMPQQKANRTAVVTHTCSTYQQHPIQRLCRHHALQPAFQMGLRVMDSHSVHHLPCQCACCCQQQTLHTRKHRQPQTRGHHPDAVAWSAHVFRVLLLLTPHHQTLM
jgi:hypothetical protein